MAAVDALPLVQELEKALACLDAVEKDVDEGKRPGKDMDAFFQQLGRVDDAAAALPRCRFRKAPWTTARTWTSSRGRTSSGSSTTSRPRGTEKKT